MPALPPVERLVETRNALHRVAEHVLSAALKRATGQISLLPAPGGFATPPLPDGMVLAVEGTELTVRSGTDVRRVPLTTVGEVADAAGTTAGFPWTKHPPGTPFEPDEPLTVDPQSAQVLADWYALGAAALVQLASEMPEYGPTEPAIFPEHFDLGMSADRVNYGVSPGDAVIELPYLYVGPHEGPPTPDDFWNASFGAYVDIRAIGSVEDAVDFFRSGRERVRAIRSDSRSTA